MKDEISYSTLTVKAMFKLYNEHAERLRRPLMRKRPLDRVEMAKALAILLTYRLPLKRTAVANKKGRIPETREVAIDELCQVSHYEVAVTSQRVEVAQLATFSRRVLISYGFQYAEVLKRVKARLPKSKTSGAALRVHAAAIRQCKPGYEGARLPDRRPHSNKGTSK